MTREQKYIEYLKISRISLGFDDAIYGMAMRRLVDLKRKEYVPITKEFLMDKFIKESTDNRAPKNTHSFIKDMFDITLDNYDIIRVTKSSIIYFLEGNFFAYYKFEICEEEYNNITLYI